ncbi:putative metal-binding motif-containing protein [Corallococcus macrosporus]|uniref:Metal-binding motif-containing protein n=1 Tax=Corallococcus macrosporus TaxID=35 RepID=A0ABS3DI27_9BACT|nr:putative metal-binding motif-containing protein [Corallococcus macrosporus]MBN8230979.1 putative metal-binding motif-containing protein [Corallococcus macrosporus]
MKRLLLLLPLWALAGCKDPQDGVKVVVTYTQFVPGCVRVTATDDASGDTLATDVSVREKNATPDGEIVVGVLVPEKWGTTISVRADAFEALPVNKQCGGNSVRNNKEGITVSKGSGKEGKTPELRLTVAAPDMDLDGYVPKEGGGTDCNDAPTELGKATNPGAAELCNDTDDNCDGEKDEGFNIGGRCTNESNSCTGTYRCVAGNVQQAECFTPDAKLALVDEDQDGHADPAKGQVFVCTATLPPNRLQLGAPSDDCNDGDPAVHPGVTEICNDKDDNCVAGKDEGFSVGTTCTDTTYQCANSTTQCKPDNSGTFCKPPDAIPTWYPDGDGDRYGRDTGKQVTCVDPSTSTVTYVADAGADCNDGNPFTHPNADELCDGEDNNCNTVTDEGACPNGGPNWIPESVNDGGAALRSISLYGDGGVWVVGDDSTRAFKRPGDTDFTVLAGKCPGGTTSRPLYSVWADSRNETAYIGGEDDVLTIQTPTSVDCTPVKPPSASGTTTGLIGFPTDGGVQLIGVTSANNGDDGRTFNWDGGVNSAAVTNQSKKPLFDVSGTLTDRLFAVGSISNSSPPNQGLVLERASGATTWSTSTVPNNTPWLRGVQVVTPRLAYAVGDSGALIKWTGGSSWTTEVSPQGVTEQFTSVLAFGEGSIYITTAAGNIYHWNGIAWQKFALAGGSLYDIAGTNPGDIWAVGNFGNVFHLMSAPPPPPP